VSEEQKGVDKSPKEEILDEVKACFKAARRHSSAWRTETVELYDFAAGKQWSDGDKATLSEQGRPVVTFDRTGPYYDAISGSEINNRQEIKYLPRTTGDAKQNELLTAAVKWALDTTNAQDQESDSFRDMLICGMGWIETTLDYDDDPDGLIKMERVDPLEMYWDPQARRKNLTDAKWIQRVKWMSEEDINEKWPDAELSTSAEPWNDDLVEKSEPHNASLAFLYRNNAGEHYDEKIGKYRVLQHLYAEKEDVWRVIDPLTKQSVFLSKEKFAIAKGMAEKTGLQLKFVKQKKKVYRAAFVCGATVLEDKALKCGWNFKCMTGKRDNNTNLWFGVGRGMKDPQLWANKFLSQIMHIVNSNAKGGLLAETGAFEDPKKAEETWADPTAVVLLKTGGLGKVKERAQTNYPQGLDKLLQFAIGSIPDVTGVNLEFLGMADREQAGVLESERKRSAYVILAGFFDSLRLYRKEQGRLLAHYVKEYLNDGRIIRITTDQGEQPVPLALTEENIEYDIVVDQAPNSPNLKQEVWGQLGALLPKFLAAGIPIPPEIFKFSPLPESVAAKFAQGAAGILPPQVQKQMQEMQQALAEKDKLISELKVGADVKMASVQSRHELGKEKNMINAQQTQNDAQSAIQALQAEIIKINAQSETKMREMHQEFIRDMEINRRETAAELIKIAAQAESKRAEQQMRAAERKEKASSKEGASINIGELTNAAKEMQTTSGKNAEAVLKATQDLALKVDTALKGKKKKIKLIKDEKGDLAGAEVEES
jgi:hypothetical protein